MVLSRYRKIVSFQNNKVILDVIEYCKEAIINNNGAVAEEDSAAAPCLNVLSFLKGDTMLYNIICRESYL